MSFLRLLIAFSLLLGSTAAATAQEVSPAMESEVDVLKAKADEFFRQLSDKTLGPDRAVREIIGNGPLKERAEVAKLIEQADGLDQRFGRYTGHELISARAVGSDLVFLKYLYKGERFPVVWCFTFYRSTATAPLKRDWTLIGLKFDSKIESLDR